MLLHIAGLFLVGELLITLVSGYIFWYFWSRSALGRATAIKAIGIYALGCAACLLLALFLPL